MASRNHPRGRAAPPPSPPAEQQTLPVWTNEQLAAWLPEQRGRVSVLNVMHQDGCPAMGTGRGCVCEPDHILVSDDKPIAQIVWAQ